MLPPKPKSRHHRRPESRGGDSTHNNISKVPENKHQAWHLLFNNHTPEVIAEFINKIWLDPAYKLVVVKVKRKEKGRSHLHQPHQGAH